MTCESARSAQELEDSTLASTERERLQGFPDGWTIPYGPSLAPQNQDLTDPERPRWATPSRSLSPSGSAGASSTQPIKDNRSVVLVRHE